MNTTWRWITSLFILTLLALMLWACGAAMSSSRSQLTATPDYAAPAAGVNQSSNPDYASAQATMDAGQRQMLELSRKATEVSLNQSQAANAAAQSTQDSLQRQQMELDYQSTVVSLNIAKAAATQKFISQQTKMARNATAAAQSRAATATQSAYLAKVNQTEQAAIALTAYPLTATPFAATQAAMLMLQYDREQQAFKDRVVAPLIPIIATTLGLLVVILVIVLVYRWFNRMPWPRRLRIGPGNVIIDGVIVDHNPQFHRITPFVLTPLTPPGLPGENPVQVEIVDAAQPPVAHWIAEVEQQVAAEGGPQL
jgi:hypothetical protein